MKRKIQPDVKSEHNPDEPGDVISELYRVKKEAEHNKLLKNYKNFSKQSVIYSVGDVVGLSAEDPHVVRFIGRITGIWNVTQPHEVQCIDINWYYTKVDLPTSLQANYISNSEVFPSDVTTSIYAGSIVSKIKILNEKEGNEASALNPAVERMSRAKFSRRTNTFDPAPEEWIKSCMCLQPINLDLEYVQCDSCQDWLHNQKECTGLHPDDMKNTDSYICQRCVKDRE